MHKSNAHRLCCVFDSAWSGESNISSHGETVPRVPALPPRSRYRRSEALLSGDNVLMLHAFASLLLDPYAMYFGSQVHAVARMYDRLYCEPHNHRAKWSRLWLNRIKSTPRRLGQSRRAARNVVSNFPLRGQQSASMASASASESALSPARLRSPALSLFQKVARPRRGTGSFAS